MESTALLEKINDLPRLPKAVSELLDAVNNDNTSVKNLSEKLAQDPVISARVLRLANSAHFGRNREVSSIEEAVIRLGQQTLKTLVIASAVVGAVPKVEGFDLASFWGETFEISLYSQELAKRCDIAADETFTCGILHKIGELLIATAEPELAQQIKAAVDVGGVQQELEEKLLGTDAPSVGALLAKTWNFAPSLVQGIQFQRNPLAANPQSKPAALLYLSHLINRNWDDSRVADAFGTWLSMQANDVGIIKMDISGAADKFGDLRGKGLEIGKQLV
ncbi:HDOD domain-containing protein [Shewanella olleyana]|uniref:HDOD domain-containing protein n=1 Tax=Shewanella olleyana TaxID=135626 RepID=UPI00200F8E8E|nr:HDOD domain-containing protein [Shewanella olleyana]MCL1066172.1 HDOD domain-containing protein [Shewanella olleyana]